ncbi:alpha/beta fold hydrolase [Sphingomonas alba]|uniref:Alpha/beta hydrolase n=1 Tax=Sphingomonas alba TaxID=2908208 RepID=A0ABT0RMM2_9SPHN|nr:alpha/beta hydrolase [Sphingomonas alba]MCL6683891.1 alpha/beta hydrolase [Sphingomonas alba]
MTGFSERRWTTPDGLSLYARDYPAKGGEKHLPVLCLHGFTRNSADFEDLAPVLAESGRRVIVMDVRGRGKSDWDPAPKHYHPKFYAQDVIGFLGALGIPKAVFLGTSMGGLITFVVALLRPKLIWAAILNDVGPAVDPAGIARIQSYAGKAPVVRTWEDAADYCRIIYESAWPFYGPADWQHLARRTFRDSPGGPVLDYDPAIASAPGAKTKTSSLLAWFALRRLAKRVPTLVIRGENSDILSAAIAERMRRKAPALDFAVIPGVGHAPTLAEPESLSAIHSFLVRVP